ncbi:sulfatase-like hydrolase/transferase [Parasphaerochaeta coccoides]|nr:sulfatase-like hydrolase/transferase [Parasphaerochaeta coccoides]
MSEKAPNILFIVTDDQRYDTINALGNEEIITPNFDRLVSEGTSFLNAYIPCGLTGAVCMPSRAMIHTGKGLYGLQGNGEDIPCQDTLLGEHLIRHGYHAFGTGKWHNGPSSYTRSFTEGDNAFFSGMWDHWNVPVCKHDPTGEYDNVINFVMDFYNAKDVTKIYCDSFNPGIHSSNLLADTTIQFLENYEGTAPFFCYTAFLAPHDPRTMPQEFHNMYDGRKVSVPANFLPEYPVSYGDGRIRDEMLAPYPRTPERIIAELTDYYAMITHVDHEIGRILDVLRKKGLYEDTLIIFCSDNGLGLGSHAFMGKQNHFEHSIKVPLIFAGSGIPRGRTVTANVYLHDIYPTLCELLGLDIPASVEGRSFLKCFSTNVQHREELYYSYGSTIRSIRSGDYKLMEYIGLNGERSSLLYDIAHDSMELHDLFAPDEPLVAELRTRLLVVREQEGDVNRPESRMFWERY